MKKLIFLISLLFIVTILSNCQKEEQVQHESTEAFVYDEQISQNPSSEEVLCKLKIGFEQHMIEISQNDEVANRDCIKKITIPDDGYYTIQEAIDAVCDNGEVIVNNGIYTEAQIFVYKPGIQIVAYGEVIVEGGFFLWTNEAFGYNADKVVIDGFILNSTVAGITAENNLGGKFSNNVFLESSFGIQLYGDCSGLKIKHNIFSKTYYGITTHHFCICNNSSISSNEFFGNYEAITGAESWWFSGDNNIFQGNFIDGENDSRESQYGIIMYGLNNVVKNNQVTNTYEGFKCRGKHNKIGPNNKSYNNHNGIYLAGVENDLGPGNEFNNNDNYGIGIYFSHSNYIFNNTAQNNTSCDIFDIGSNNTFQNNIYGTFCP